jgi:Thioredoxin
MAPEFEEAAKELLGKVRFVKLDTDLDPDIAQRLNIMGLPTLLFLDKFEPKEGEENAGARAVLKGRVEGAPSVCIFVLQLPNVGLFGNRRVGRIANSFASLTLCSLSQQERYGSRTCSTSASIISLAGRSRKFSSQREMLLIRFGPTSSDSLATSHSKSIVVVALSCSSS